MTAYYDIVNTIKQHFEDDPLVNRVTFGELDEVATQKVTIYPLVHFDLPDVSVDHSTFVWTCNVVLADLETRRNDNEGERIERERALHDQSNALLAIGTRFVEKLRRGSLAEVGYHLVLGSASFERFDEGYIDGLHGWVLSVQIRAPHSVPQCDQDLTINITNATNYSGTLNITEAEAPFRFFQVVILNGTGSFRPFRADALYNVTNTDLNLEIKDAQPMRLSVPSSNIEIGSINEEF